MTTIFFLSKTHEKFQNHKHTYIHIHKTDSDIFVQKDMRTSLLPDTFKFCPYRHTCTLWDVFCTKKDANFFFSRKRRIKYDSKLCMYLLPANTVTGTSFLHICRLTTHYSLTYTYKILLKPYKSVQIHVHKSYCYYISYLSYFVFTLWFIMICIHIGGIAYRVVLITFFAHLTSYIPNAIQLIDI